MLLQGLREAVSGCVCLRFAILAGLIPELVVCFVCIVGFHENSEHWPSAGCALHLRTLWATVLGLSTGVSPALAILSCCMLISRNCGCLGSCLHCIPSSSAWGLGWAMTMGACGSEELCLVWQTGM